MKGDESAAGRALEAKPFAVRLATLEDLPIIVTLNPYVQGLHADALPEVFRRAPPTGDVTTAFKALMEHPSALWLLAETEQPCAYISAQFTERAETWSRPAHRACVINHLSVRPADRRQGVGGARVDAVIAEARIKEFTRSEIDAWKTVQRNVAT